MGEIKIMSTSKAQLKAAAKHSKENYQHLSFKVRIGSKERIKEAAEATNQSVNAFIKNAVSKAMMEAIGKPLEPTIDDIARNMVVRIFTDLLSDHTPAVRNRMETRLKPYIENNTDLHKEFVKILSSDLSPKQRKKALEKLEQKKTEEISDLIFDSVIPVLFN